MSTFMQKPSQVERKWYIIDAAGKPMGRVAAQAAILLRGKHKPTIHHMLTVAIMLSSLTVLMLF